MEAKFEAADSIYVIVGANSGIGISLSAKFKDAEAIVVGIDIQDVAAENLYVQDYFQVDTLDEKAMLDCVGKVKEKYRQINGLICLSGSIVHFDTVEGLDVKQWSETYDVSFKSCLLACKSFSALMQGVPNSAIVNMSSGLAFIGREKYGPYSAAKAAIVSLTKTLATELAPHTRVNTVAPGAVDTKFIYDEDGGTRFDRNVYESIVPLGRIAKPSEISSVIMFLLSDAAAYVTGECIHINGGAL